MAKKKPAKRDIYQVVTDKIISFMDAGNLPPWRHPIINHGGAGFPKNLTTGKEYRGVNIFLLGMTAWMEGYSSAHWLTFKQCKEKGGQVRKGEKATPIIFWKLYEKEDKESGEVTKLPVLRHYNVFSVEQCEGIEAPDMVTAEPIEFKPIDAAERIVGGYPNPPTIEQGGNAAFYVARDDKIKISEPQNFETSEAYYATLFHELAHSSGHKKRLNRPDVANTHVFGTPEYGKEELTAEFGSAMLCGQSGISPATIEQSAAYISGWKKKIKSDNKLVIQAAALAQRAADHILGVSFSDAADLAPAEQEPPTATAAPARPPTHQLGFGF